MRFEGKVVAVTGAASGIGRATAQAFAGEGASVVVADVNGDGAEQIAKDIVTGGGRAVGVRTDVTDAQDAEAMVRRAVEEFGGLDVLVNNAGVEWGGTVESTPEQEWDHVMAVNVKGGFLCSKYAVPEIRRRGGGVILFTASVAGIQGVTGQAVYSASKAAVANLARSMALDHARDNIRVNYVCPGGTRTAMIETIMEQLPELAKVLEDTVRRLVPLGGRLADPGEIANAFVFLASDEAGFISGQALVVDGAQSAGIYIREMLDS